jgi:hypothetical protein
VSGQVRQLTVRESPAGKDVTTKEENIVETHYQATADEDIIDLACVVERNRVLELVRSL